jgi:hypothetical protein
VKVSDVDSRTPDIQMHPFHVVRFVGCRLAGDIREENVSLWKQSHYVEGIDQKSGRDGIRANRWNEVKREW